MYEGRNFLWRSFLVRKHFFQIQQSHIPTFEHFTYKFWLQNEKCRTRVLLGPCGPMSQSSIHTINLISESERRKRISGHPLMKTPSLVKTPSHLRTAVLGLKHLPSIPKSMGTSSACPGKGRQDSQLCNWVVLLFFTLKRNLIQKTRFPEENTKMEKKQTAAYLGRAATVSSSPERRGARVHGKLRPRERLPVRIAHTCRKGCCRPAFPQPNASRSSFGNSVEHSVSVHPAASLSSLNQKHRPGADWM